MTRLPFISCPSDCWIRRWAFSSLTLVLLFSSPWHVAALENACGGYFSIGKGTQVFYSPDYPSSYSEGTYCIWIIVAARDYRVKITFSFQGDRYNGNCADYLEIRDGGPNSAILGTYCDTHTNVELTTSNIWLYVLLKSDQIVPSTTPAQMVATVSGVFNSTPVSDVTNQVPDCRSYQFECTNAMCISMSYRCDSYNDCGCLDGCDEDGCGSLSINLATQVGISVSVGFVLFVIICLIAHLFEGKNVWMGNKTEAVANQKPYFKKQGY